MHAYHIWQLTDHTAVIAQHGPRLQTIRKQTVLCVTEHALYKGKHTLRRSRCARHGEHHACTLAPRSTLSGPGTHRKSGLKLETFLKFIVTVISPRIHPNFMKFHLKLLVTQISNKTHETLAHGKPPTPLPASPPPVRRRVAVTVICRCRLRCRRHRPDEPDPGSRVHLFTDRYRTSVPAPLHITCQHLCIMCYPYCPVNVGTTPQLSIVCASGGEKSEN